MSDTSTPTKPRRKPDREQPHSGTPRASLKQLWPYLFEDKKMMAVIIVISIVGSAFDLAQPILMGLLIQRVEAGEFTSWIVWVLIAVVLVAALLSGLQHFLLQRTGERIVLNARRHLVRKILRLPIAEFDARRTGDLVSRVGSDTTLLRAVLTQGLIEAIGGTLTFVGAVIAMLLLDWVLFLITISCIVVSLVIVVFLARKVATASAAAQEKVGELTASVERAISAMRTLRASVATEREEARVMEDAEGAYRRGLDIAAISAVMVPVSMLALQLSLVAVLGVGGVRVAAGETSIASLISFIMFLFMMIAPLGLMFGAVSAVASALGALGRIEEIRALPDEDADDRSDAPLVTLQGPANVGAQPSAPALEFDAVSFRYPDNVVRAARAKADASGRFDRFVTQTGRAARKAAEELLTIDESDAVESPLVLDDVSFTVPRGHKVALVGPSGAGKSTTLALIERFYDPSSGVIRMGGVDLRAIDRSEMRAQLGYVQQNSPTLAGTIRDNLLLGRPDASDEECVEVLRDVNLGDVLDRSPDGLDAQVGEAGVRLSGGEQQRLAIARTLLAAPPILLMDESTSALDGRNEALIRDALDRAAEGRSMVMIAHRLSTVVDADELVVLDHGRVVGRGTHEELIETTPLYRRLAQHQLLA
ncbi:ABC transporter ATP-binding protein [Gulosibacter molinativorax]|uniref:ABC transporter ATP-binding protein n=1 Tax=Gulosibacter molinativorax TaxID=256821 RepID=A0ABT7CB78_9MICO|nr:ABC transporter ATP-binding protein [Gulosibacter molinativorax]MDJ1372343.1 ABC transporter ATP-binding protein [Gulosibacter molinativorax]QUY63567.1 Multidrug resistance ABC transporter ATP-binding/permease protein BmrA [Gulosibacter molinativorax]